MSARDSLLPLYLVSLIGALGFSIVLLFLVFLIEDFGGNAFVCGLIGAAYALFTTLEGGVFGLAGAVMLVSAVLPVRLRGYSPTSPVPA
jgi:cell division protein FtsW (lipid II flippase)